MWRTSFKGAFCEVHFPPKQTTNRKKFHAMILNTHTRIHEGFEQFGEESCDFIN